MLTLDDRARDGAEYGRDALGGLIGRRFAASLASPRHADGTQAKSRLPNLPGRWREPGGRDHRAGAGRPASC
jgi:hypothetical protein